MMSPSDEERIVAMVDSFTKTVARNFSRNLKRAKANAEKHYSDEPVDYLLETLSHDDRYPSDHFVLYADELWQSYPGFEEIYGERADREAPQHFLPGNEGGMSGFARNHRYDPADRAGTCRPADIPGPR